MESCNKNIGGADLHLHSSFSDGRLRPSEIVRKAKEAGLEVISLTDHDTLEGVPEAIEAGAEYGIEIIPGVELSCSEGEIDIHILGYFVDHKASPLLKLLAGIKERRLERMGSMIDKLNQLGLKIDKGEFFEQFRDAHTVGRLHLANYLLEKKLVTSIQDAFNQYIGGWAPAYENVKMLSLEEGIRLIRDNGGVAVYAHPCKKDIDKLLPKLVKLGIRGIEIYYPGYSDGERRHYLATAKRMGLIATGGSDDHGYGNGDRVIGSIRLPIENVALLRKIARETS
ncbi:MAG: PHP domain-containing protein [Nitrospinae bacterium]|nr:PHP domain-containing protein [Nitrospinota bacterium]